MDKQITNFLEKNRVSVFTTILADRNPHSATLHFADSIEPLYFVFWTEKNSRKCSHFVLGSKYPASLVIGFSEEEFKTMQMEGEVYIADGKELDEAYKVYRTKFGGPLKFEGGENDVLLKFVPKWYRYTEFKPKKFVIESK